MTEYSQAEFNNRVQGVFSEAVYELSQIGIYPAGEITQVKINTRSRKRLGACRKTDKRPAPQYIIEISAICSELDDKRLKEIIIHELLHTGYGCMNHGKKWKACAEKVRRELGYMITATVDYGKIGLQETMNDSYRYKVKCEACGQQMLRIRKSKVIVHPELYRCAKCGGKLNVIKLQN